jgi:hypothetical protein
LEIRVSRRENPRFQPQNVAQTASAKLKKFEPAQISLQAILALTCIHSFHSLQSSQKELNNNGARTHYKKQQGPDQGRQKWPIQERRALERRRRQAVRQQDPQGQLVRQEAAGPGER